MASFFCFLHFTKACISYELFWWMSANCVDTLCGHCMHFFCTHSFIYTTWMLLIFISSFVVASYSAVNHRRHSSDMKSSLPRISISRAKSDIDLMLTSVHPHVYGASNSLDHCGSVLVNGAAKHANSKTPGMKESFRVYLHCREESREMSSINRW